MKITIIFYRTIISLVVAANTNGYVSHSRALGGLFDYAGKSVALVSCDADAISGMENVTCEFDTTASSDVSVLHAEITLGDCESSGLRNSAATSYQDSDADQHVTASTIDNTITADDRNQATVNRTYCARADVIDKEYELSVLAKLVELEVTYNFAQDGTFQVVGINTDIFGASKADAISTRSVLLYAKDNDCENKGTSSQTSYKIGDTLTICVWTNDADVQITSFFDVVMNIRSPTVGTVIALPNFVTEEIIPHTAEASMKTLLISSIYDYLGGDQGEISIDGKVELDYQRRRISDNKERFLRGKDSALFSLKVALSGRETIVPAVARSQLKSGDRRLGGVGLSITAIVLGSLAMI